MRDAIAEYIRERKLDKPVIVGHSLGGFLALSVAAANPDLVGRLVIVDGLPAPGAEQNAVAEVVIGDVRADLARAEAPALVLVSLPPLGASVDKVAVEQGIRSQFNYMKHWQLELAPPTARHFIMYDEDIDRPPIQTSMTFKRAPKAVTKGQIASGSNSRTRARMGRSDTWPDALRNSGEKSF